jgi:hypothetical protein
MSVGRVKAPSDLFNVSLHWLFLGEQGTFKSMYATVLAYTHKDTIRENDMLAPEDKLDAWRDTFRGIPRDADLPPMRFTSYEEIFREPKAEWSENLKAFLRKRQAVGWVSFDDIEGYLRRNLGPGIGNVANFITRSRADALRKFHRGCSHHAQA